MNNNLKTKLKEFREKTAEFAAGNISVKDYKGFSGYFGSYAQRGAKNSMLRLRILGGQLSLEALNSIIELCDKYNIENLHCTTCQTIQLHDIPFSDVADIMEDAIESGFFTLGGGGDFPRNVMVSPLSGVQKGENFDVSPYAKEAADFLLSQLGNVKMPRKLKVCFSNSPENAVHATFRDLGFVSRPDGLFDVYCAGGMGANPKMGVKVKEAAQPSQALYYIKAMIALFCKYGNYENRAKARTRYMQDVLGDKLTDEFNIQLNDAINQGGLDINPQTAEITKTGDDEEIDSIRVIPQKQRGLYAVICHTVGGKLTPDMLKRIYDTIKDFSDVSLRLAPDEGMYVINCTAKEAKAVLTATDFCGSSLIEWSTACIGASICQQGLRDSQALLNSILDAVKPYNFAPDALPQLHISGCMSSCGTHEIGKIGFMGRVKMINKKPVPGFTISIKGCDKEGMEHFGDELGTIASDDIPEFIVELGKQVTAAGMNYDTYAKEHETELLELINEYTKRD